MTEVKRIEIAHGSPDGPLLSATAMSLLFGVPPDQIAQLPNVNGASVFPKQMIECGKRRAREAKRWGKSEALFDVLAYWAAKDLDAKLVKDADATVWAITEVGFMISKLAGSPRLEMHRSGESEFAEGNFENQER